MSKAKRPWCSEPFHTFSHSSGGFYKPCCEGESMGVTTYDMLPSEFLKSDVMKNFRQKMWDHNIDDEVKKVCTRCIKREENGLESRRIFRNGMVGRLPMPPSPTYLRFKMLGNLCNFRCVMCYPGSSSKIAAEEKVSPAILNPYGEGDREAYFEDIIKLCDNVQEVQMLGGEPFIHPDIEYCIESLARTKNAKKMTLTLTTNASTFPEWLPKAMKHFGNHRIHISMDGIGGYGEYIRDGCNWEEFDANVKKFKENFRTLMQPTIQLLNMNHLKELGEYCVENSEIGWTWPHMYLIEPRFLRPINLPDKVRMKYRAPHFHEPLRRAMFSEERNHDHFLEGIAYLKQKDKLRNKCLLDLWPEFEEWYA